MKRLINLFIKAIKILTIIFCIFILIGTLLKWNNLLLLRQMIKYPILIYLPFSILFGYFLVAINKYIDGLNNKRLRLFKIGLLVVLFLIQFIIIRSFNIPQSTDAYVTNDQAVSITMGLEKKVTTVSNPYFGQYSNNNFYLVLSIFLARLFKTIQLDYNLGFIIFNILMIDCSILLLCLIGKKIKGEKFASKLLLFSVLNPLNYFLIHWTYTITYSVPLLLLCVYLALLLKEDEKSKLSRGILSILLGITIAVGYYLRPIIVILVIAIGMCFLINIILKKDHLRRYLFSIVIVFLSLVITYIGIGKINNIYIDNGNNTWPVTHWLMIGIHGDGTVSAKDNAFTRSFKTKEKMKEANIKEIKNTLKSYGLVGFGKHSIKKLLVNWYDGSANYYYRMYQDKNNSFIYDITVGNRRDLVVVYCQIFRIVTIAFVIISIFNQLKTNNFRFEFLMTLSIFGAILFYLIWEVKTSYHAPFLPFLFILSIDGIDKLKEKILVLDYKKLINISFIIIGIFTILLEIVLCNNFTKKKEYFNYYSVNVLSPVTGMNEAMSRVNRDSLTIKQEFISKGQFNNICIKSDVIKDDKKIRYDIKLLAGDKLLKSYSVNSDDIEKESLCLDVDKGVTAEGNKYTIMIEHSKQKDDSISFKTIKYRSIDIYDGDMYINNKKVNNDLVLKVYNHKKEVYMNKQVYLLLSKCLLIIEFLIYMFVKKMLIGGSKSERSSRIINRKK